MSTAVPYDPAIPVIEIVQSALVAAFTPTSTFPPPSGGSGTVHVVAGEGPAIDLMGLGGCDSPFLWIRLMRRYRTTSFPEPTTAATCAAARAIAVEIGVGRCAVLAENPTVEQYDEEADASLDDSWRIELALCRAAAMLQAQNYVCAVDAEIVPNGPVGGIICWSGSIHTQLD